MLNQLQENKMEHDKLVYPTFCSDKINIIKTCTTKQ
jgi:hypothetical protein